MLDECKPQEAKTQYLLFLVAFHQKRETGGKRGRDRADIAINAIQTILNCPDVNPEIVKLIASLTMTTGGPIAKNAVRAILKLIPTYGVYMAVMPSIK